jgi:hypothetical protein
LGASGAVVMSFFGAVFASMTLLLQLHWSGLELGLPFIGFAVIATAAMIVVRLPGNGFARPEGSGRVMLWSSIGEGLGVFLVSQMVVYLGHSDLIPPAIALVVGLHFIPIAYWAPFWPLYILAAVIVAGGIIGLLMNQPAGGTVSGLTAAAALVGASIAAIRRERLAKSRTGDACIRSENHNRPRRFQP